MEFVVGVLALVGLATLVVVTARFASSARRVLEAANAIGASGMEVVSAIEANPVDEARQFTALGQWEAACALVRALNPREREQVARMLDTRGFPMREVGRVVAGFMERADWESAQVDHDLAVMGSPRR